MYIEENVPLAPFTTFQIGGPARFFVRATSVEDLREALAYAKEKDIKTLILGGGSNMLFDDEGFDGLVIKNEITGVEIEKTADGAILIAEAGENWDHVVARSVAEGLWGLENLSGIPGTVGAAPVQNIGAYGRELKDAFLWAEVLDVGSGRVVRMDAGACQFGYRMSLFKATPGRYAVLRVALRLLVHDTAHITYRDLAEAFQYDSVPSVVEVREAVLRIRARKFPDLTKEGTAGSFFLNPIVSKEKAAELRHAYPELPQFPALQGTKLSLAWLLDNVLNLRGFAVGSARLFEKQPLVIVASRNATSQDVITLMHSVMEKVQDIFSISLEEEVRIINKK